MCCNKSQAKSAFVFKWGLRLLHDQRDVLRGQSLDEIEHENTSPNKYKDLKEIIGASSLKEFAQFQFQTPKIGSHFPPSNGDLSPNGKAQIWERGRDSLASRECF